VPAVIDVFDSATSNADEAYLTSHRGKGRGMSSVDDTRGFADEGSEDRSQNSGDRSQEADGYGGQDDGVEVV
jgi:hypothetical protein